jgi:citrate lyase beta subunit
LFAFRSVVFVEACDAYALSRALASGADAVVADLEDATPAERKAEARAIVAKSFGANETGPARLVRLNAAGSEHLEADLALVRSLDLAGVAVPQATPEAVDELAELGLPLLAVVESARGLRSAYEIASRPHVRALQLGAKDLAGDLRLESRPDALELLYARSRLVVDAVAAGIDSVLDRVLLSADNDELERDARFARSLGFTGKSTTTPDDVAIINRVFCNREKANEYLPANAR